MVFCAIASIHITLEVKMKKALYFLAFGLFTPSILNGQTVIRGTVRDSVQTIPYASVYLKNHPEKGMQSSEDGMFFFQVEKNLLPDTLVVSAIGYRNFFTPMAAIDTVNIDAVLSQDIVMLEGVEVKGKKRIWRKAMREAWWKMHDAQIQETVRNYRFIFRVSEYQPLKALYTYIMVPATNYVKIEGDSLTVSECWAGAMVRTEMGDLRSIEEYNPRIDPSQRIRKKAIRLIDLQEDNGEMMLVVNSSIIISIPKNIKTDAAILRVPKLRLYYKGWIEPLPYREPPKEELQTIYRRTPRSRSPW